MFRALILVTVTVLMASACQSATVPEDVQDTATPVVASATAPARPTGASIPSEPVSPPPSPTPAPSETPTSAPSATTIAPPSPAPPSPAPPTLAPTAAETRASPPASPAIIIDHTAVDLFDKIPPEYLERARNLRVVFINASVGFNISNALDCLTAPSWGRARSYCRRDYIDDRWNWIDFGPNALPDSIPERIRFDPDPVLYDRSNWTYVRDPGTWYAATEKFVTQQFPEYRDRYDVLSYKITYLHVTEDSGINDPETGFFAATPNRYGWEDLEALRQQNPDKTFFYWTSSLSRGIGSQAALEFNERMRQIARDEGLILFDIADIEAHTDQGVPCYDNRDGVEYCTEAGKCENYPDDGLDLPAICQDYTTETDGGHLGSVSGGGIRLAKAFWVLIARIAGWQP